VTRKEQSQIPATIALASLKVIIRLNGNTIEQNLSTAIAVMMRMEQTTQRLSTTMIPTQ